MRRSRKLIFSLAACTLMGAGLGLYFWVYPMLFFSAPPADTPRETQLRADGFVYDPDTVYALEFLEGGTAGDYGYFS